MEAFGSKDNRSPSGEIIWNTSNDIFEFSDMEIENVDSKKLVIKQSITNESHEELKLPGETENAERKDEEETPLITFNDGYQKNVSRFPGQVDEADQSVDQKGGPSSNDVRPHSTSEWGDAAEQQRKARQELNERDHNSVEYSKSLLDEGDTLVYVSFPGGITFYDFKGEPQPYKIYRASSDKLKALGSAKFSRMFEERPQHWARKRKGFLHYLPENIKYVLDLTPLEEGDEAVELVSELSCSAGIRNWYLAEKRCGVEKHLVAGDDDIPGPAIVPAKTAEQFGLKVPVDGYIAFLSSQSRMDSPVNDKFVFTSLGRTVPKNDAIISDKSVQDSNMQRAIKNSLEDGHLFIGPSGSGPVGTAHDGSTEVAGSKKKVLDYCPIRHRFGVENLLRIIQGKVPKLDSAPKVWTLFVLAKYYECTSVVIDYITSWIMNGNNIKFLEVLPEASINIGLGLRSPMITRAAFSILVSEEALNVASRTFCEGLGRRAEYKYLRPREELDEDLWNVIQHASQDFCDRVQKIITDLVDERMAWFLEIPEYKKICKFEDYCYKKKDNSKEDEAIYERRKSVIQRLLVNLRRFVRGKIITCLNQGLEVFEITMASKSQREAQWEVYAASGIESNEGLDPNYIYNGLGDRERVLLPHFWRRLRDVYWEDDFESPKLNSYNPQLIRSGKSLVDRDNIRLTNTCDLAIYANDFNREVNLAVNKENYNPSSRSNPLPTIPPAKTKSLDEERPNYAFMSAYNQDHAYHQARLSGIRALELERAEFDEKTDDAASISSVSTDASTKPLLNLPLRSKPDKVTVANRKDEYYLNAQPGPSTEAKEKSKNSTPNVLKNFLQHLGHKSLDDYKAHRAFLLAGIPHLDLETGSSLLSKDTPNFTFANTSTPFSANSNPYQLNEPPHNFKLCCFLDELKSYTDHICQSILSKSDGSENNMLTDTLLCLTDKEWQYLPLWAGGNDDGSGGVTSADVPPAYYANVGGLTPGVMYKGASGFVGVGTGMGSERNSSLDVKDGSARTETEMGAGSQVGSQTGIVGDDDGESDTGSVFSTGSYDMATMTPTGSGSDFEIVSSGEDEGLESGDDFTIDGDSVSVSEREMSDGEFDAEDKENEKGKGKEMNDEMMDEDGSDGEDDMDWTDQEDMVLEDDLEDSFTDL
ncbi:uncharacterized protein Bfra_006096 [Botrytis fragariae]|uniref:Uncharacterized protein n=1 Tax=Botrytis fragariae TaxID=1964551 RepID=A0A8H6EHU0_9HELO|nr:uncharacterized protein Bfra_006096 [Botrytis fragariae]KAF5872733.1 hypothetical protein Bfra_006096 [Botrytis fragariae]